MKQDELLALKTWLGTGSINIFGLPFSGKDTQSKRLSILFDAPIISGGQILRETPIPERVRQIMETGALIPTEDYINIVLPYLSQQEFNGKPLILSSLGRWDGEQQGVTQACESAGHPQKAIIFLQLSEASTWKRWKASQLRHVHDRVHRADDAEESLRNRFDEYATKTLPVIEYYRKKGLVIDIDGEAPPEEVYEQILAGLQKLSRAAASQ